MNQLTDEEKRVIIGKGTELPFSGELLNENRSGTFVCRQCDAPLREFGVAEVCSSVSPIASASKERIKTLT